MLIKLNKGEGITVQVNHNDNSASYCIQCFDGKTLYLREFPSGESPKSEIKEAHDSSQQVQGGMSPGTGKKE